MLFSKIPGDNFSNLLRLKNLPKIIQKGVVNIVFVTKVQEISMIRNIFKWRLGRYLLIVFQSWVMSLDNFID